jgi:signal transduction histidine kinase
MRIVPTSILPWASEQLKSSHVVHISRASDLPPEAQTERERMRTQGIRSVINVPIVLGKTLVGFLGFDTLRAEKHWAEESITLLRVVGEIIANALERKRAAERQQQLQAQLLQTQKLEAIGTLAGGIAHDFNNILAAIMGYTELVTDDVPDDSLTRRNLEEVLTASRRARKFVQQLLTFSRPVDRNVVRFNCTRSLKAR